LRRGGSGLEAVATRRTTTRRSWLCLFVVYGSPSPFFPFFFAGSASRGRVAGGGGASTFGEVTSVFGGAGLSSSAFGGGGNVICSSFGSVDAGGSVPSSSVFAASA